MFERILVFPPLVPALPALGTAPSPLPCSAVLASVTTSSLGKNSLLLSTPNLSQLAVDLDLAGTSIALNSTVAMRNNGGAVYGRWSDIEVAGSSTTLQVCLGSSVVPRFIQLLMVVVAAHAASNVKRMHAVPALQAPEGTAVAPVPKIQGPSAIGAACSGAGSSVTFDAAGTPPSAGRAIGTWQWSRPNNARLQSLIASQASRPAITFSANDAQELAAGTYTLQLTATNWLNATGEPGYVAVPPIACAFHTVEHTLLSAGHGYRHHYYHLQEGGSAAAAGVHCGWQQADLPAGAGQDGANLHRLVLRLRW